MAHIESLGSNPTLLDVYRRHTGIARHVLGFAQTAFDLTGEITHAECELLGAFVSGLNGCSYCHGIHTAAAQAGGIDPAQIVAPHGLPPAYGGPRWVPVFEYVRALTTAPASVDRNHVRELREAGWSEDAVTQFAAIAAVFAVLNRLVEGLGLEADESFQAQAGKRLASTGYGGTARLLGLEA